MPNLSNLPIEDRLQLVQDLWDSIAADTSAVPVDADQLAEVRKRLAKYRGDQIRGELARDAAESIRSTL